jgi:nitrite reductase/ring-hydroxylating ferredoxin subunit
MAFIPLEKLHALHDGYRRTFRIAGQEWLLIQDEGRLVLIANRCPHMDAPLHKGTVNRGLIRCPVHGMEFDLHTGRALGSAAACVAPLTFYPVVYESNMVGIDVE